jgi:hypothetical protein
MARPFPIPQTLFAFGLAALSALPFIPSAKADAKLACNLLLQSAVSQIASPHRLQVVKTRNLFRTEQRPYSLVPEGAAIWVRAPEGTTAADLHRRLTECTRRAGEGGTPICVAGSRISVDRDHGLYVVQVTSKERDSALEIQHRAERL